MRLLFVLFSLLLICSSTSFARMYYPGNGSNGRTPADEVTAPKKYYPPQKPNPNPAIRPDSMANQQQ